ncbi:uncharacterized protein misp3 [Vanacampus margaritifer]
MATVSLQKQASLDSAALDQKTPRAVPEDSTEVFQGCREQGQNEETMTEWIQVPQLHKSHEKLDDFKMLNGQDDFLRDFSSLEVEVPEWPSDDDINSYNESPDCDQNVQPFSPCGDSSPALVFSQMAPESITEEEETNICSCKSSPCSHPKNPPLYVIDLDNQQGALPPQSQDLTPKGANQEAAQQVLGQNSAPLSGVAMEPPNQGGAASKGSVCVVTVGERQADRAGRRTKGEIETGEQNHSGPGGDKVEVRSYELIQIQEGKGENKDGADCPNLAKMESDSSDDSGLSADFSPRSASNVPVASQETRPKETPIEREIRRTIEREHSLRRSRGLPNSSAEYVEIPLLKTILNQTVARSEKFHGLDRELAGKIMQHEIHEEVGREQDLVKLGKVPGFYDKGTVRQLKEKKQLFEAFQNRTESSSSGSSSSSSSSSSSESRDDISSQASTVRSSERRQSIEPLRGADASSTPRGPGLSEGMSCQVIIMENNQTAPTQKHYCAEAEVDRETSYALPSRSGGHTLELEEETLPKENPFFKLRSLTNGIKVEKDIREDQEREKELRKQRISLYGGGGGGGARPVGMERRSLQANVLDSSSASSSGRSRQTAARQSVGKLSAWPPGQDHGDTVDQQKVQASHSSRHKTPLVHMWESGLVNGHNLQEQ